MSIQVGPFRVHRKVAEGGFGEIWYGRHSPSGQEVAVKVLTQRHALDPAYFATFRAEVQAVARLDHPGIVPVYDFGVMPDHETDAAPPAGSPYLIMEYARAGALDQRLRDIDWSGLRAVLETTLRALGHAHARGIVHLDLKPGNILVCGEPSERTPRLKLTDFGLAQTIGEFGRTHRTPPHPAAVDADTVLGTPAYMAPEQVEGSTRDLGPWTDLYALGIIAWELATGALPFYDEDPVAIAVQQMRQSLPRFEPRFGVPPGFETWVRRLLSKPTDTRFRRAADALHALGRLPKLELVDAEHPSLARDARPVGATGPGTEARVDDGSSTTRPLERRDDDGPDAALPETLVQRRQAGADAAAASGPGPARAADATQRWVFAPDVPPFVADHRAFGEARPTPQLVGAGLGLYGLRTVPLVDRDPERAALWSALGEARASGSTRAIALVGPSGFGKSRLAEWLCTAAHESGAATSFYVGHDPGASPHAGLRALVARPFACEGASFAEARRRVDTVLRRRGVVDAYEARAIAEIIDSGGAPPLDPVGGERVRFASNHERFSVACRVLARAARERPVVAWFDDVQWSADTLAFVRHALAFDAVRGMPVLFVLTAQTETLVERPVERQLLAQIGSLDAFTRLDIGPLPTREFAALVERLLFLDGPLAREVAERAAGNPLYAVQLVGDWVERGVLVAEATGFALAQGASVDLPADLLSVWDSRASRLLAGASAAELDALALAATLGNRVPDHEYRLALRGAELPRPERVLSTLAANGLVVWEAGGWRFGHSMFRDAIARRASAPGRWHGVCADALAECHGRGASPAARRIAWHLVRAGRDADALQPLLVAADAHVVLGEYAEAHALIDEWAAALERLGAPASDPAWLDGTLLRAEVCRRQWDLAGARDAAERALVAAAGGGDYAARAEALSILGHIARLERDFVAAERLTFEALGIFESLDDFRGKARAVRAVAVTAREQMQLDRAVDNYEKALNLFWTLDEAGEVADCLVGLGHVQRTRRNYEAARAHYEEARQIAERIGNPHQLAEYTNGLAEVARYRGELDEAERMYREALSAMQRLGSRDAIIPRLNLSLTLILRGRYDDARVELLGALPSLDNPAFRAWALVHLLPCYAFADDMDLFDTTFARARQALAETAMVDNDIAEAMELCASLLEAAGHDGRVRDALLVAATQWGALDDGPKRDELLRRAGRI